MTAASAQGHVPMPPFESVARSGTAGSPESGRILRAQAMEQARQTCNLALRNAAQESFRKTISVLLEARRNHDISDETFGKLIEIVLAGYVENAVNIRVERLLDLLVTNVGSLRLGLK
ncbi:MAG: hypothetical protein GDA52_03315 [Rhodobacteraceae bacterium]|nr:hypothetical protein [Paracoccaceae bacterium]